MVGEYSPEARALLEQEGPKYQYGDGCLSDGVLGAWMAVVCGVGEVLDRYKTESHLRAAHRHNLKQDLSGHANPQRPSFAFGAEAGLLLCTWPRGGALALPFVYSNEVWTGIEYQVASHLMLLGRVDEGLEIVRACRDRYDGRVRNPFDEYECGHWYARAMSSYGLIQGLTGVRYDAVERVLYVEPRNFTVQKQGERWNEEDRSLNQTPPPSDMAGGPDKRNQPDRQRVEQNTDEAHRPCGQAETPGREQPPRRRGGPFDGEVQHETEHEQKRGERLREQVGLEEELTGDQRVA